MEFDFASGDVLREASLRHRPDILVLLRRGGAGGLADAGRLALWGLENNFEVILIAGTLDETWTPIAEAVRMKGGYVLGCLPGETINSFELLHLTYSKVKELTEKNKPGQAPRPATENPLPEMDPAVKEKALPTNALVIATDEETPKNSFLIDTAQAPDQDKNAAPPETKEKKGGILANLKRRLIAGSFTQTGGVGAASASPASSSVSPAHSVNSAPSALRRQDNPQREAPSAEARSVEPKNPGVISSGAIAIVSPWQPSLPGRLTAAAARLFAEKGDNTAVIGISKYSTVAGRLGIEDDELIMSDWRVPGSQAPVIRDKIKIWAVDPAKSLDIADEVELGLLVAKAQMEFKRVVIDCADDHYLAQKLLYQDVAIIYIVPGKDTVEQNTSRLWLNRLYDTGRNVACGIDLRETAEPVPEGLKPELIIRGSPEAAVSEMIERYI